ncbi:MAG: hypothetical protein RMZ69_02580 [Nostoc sp. ChiQUE01a]|nr:hypothetical protein [Nostoc sp. ChiQUE01a]
MNVVYFNHTSKIVIFIYIFPGRSLSSDVLKNRNISLHLSGAIARY